MDHCAVSIQLVEAFFNGLDKRFNLMVDPVNKQAHVMTHQAEVYFILWQGDFDPEVVSRALSMVPTRISRKGEARTNSPSLWCSEWTLSSGEICANVIDVQPIAAELVSILVPKEREIIEIKRRLRIEAGFVISVDRGPPVETFSGERLDDVGISLSADILRFIANVEARLDVDVYCD